MKIVVDCRFIDSSGIGSYLRGILPFFLKTNHDFILLGNVEKLSAFSSDKNIIECNIKPFSFKELFFFPKKITKQINKADLFYSPFFNIPPVSIPVFTTIHDIVFPDMPELTTKSGLAVRMWFYRKAYRKSEKIFTVSEFSKSRIEHYLGKVKPIVVTHSAVRSIFFEYKAKFSNIQKKENIVFVGNIKKHKGLDCLLDAYFLARKEGLYHKLVIIGSKDNFRTFDNSILKKIDAQGSENVIFTGFISDEKLMEFLSEASLLVQPSIYEGFGLPPLEAMILGTQVLISDIPVLKEIYDGFPVTFFQAGNKNDLKNKLIKILSNPHPVLSLPQNLEKKYNFEKTASVILNNITILKGTTND